MAVRLAPRSYYRATFETLQVGPERIEGTSVDFTVPGGRWGRDLELRGGYSGEQGSNPSVNLNPIFPTLSCRFDLSVEQKAAKAI